MQRQKPGFSTSNPTVSLIELLREVTKTSLRTLPGLDGSDGIGGGEADGDDVIERSPLREKLVSPESKVLAVTCANKSKTTTCVRCRQNV